MKELARREIKPCATVKKNGRTLYIIIPAAIVKRCELLEIPLADSLMDLFVDLDIDNKSIELTYKTSKKGD